MIEQAQISGPCDERSIKLSDGSVLEVKLTPMIIAKMREFFELSPLQILSDQQIQSYIWKAIDSAVQKVEGSVIEPR